MRKLPVLIAAILVLLLIPAPHAFPSSTSDSGYRANPTHVQVSPDTVIPNNVPLCSSKNVRTIVCDSPNFASNLNAAGQTKLIVDAYSSPVVQTDLAIFNKPFTIPAPPSFKILCITGCPKFNLDNTPLDELGWAIKTTLDIEWMAPGTNIVLVVASTSRTTPDISHNTAINGSALVHYSALSTPTWHVVNETSTSLPQWAAIIALANQYSTSQGHGPLGFINPALGKLAESSAYSSAFANDITQGNNKLPPNTPVFGATTEYNSPSGWVTVNVANLLPGLVNTVYS